MARVGLLDIDRPGLLLALAARGLDSERYGTDAAFSGAELALISSSEGWASNAADLAMPVLLVIDGDDDAVVAALDGGADDAVAASSSDALIAARVAALVRRQAAARWLRIGDVGIDTVECRVFRAGKPIALLPREYRLLLALARQPGKTVPRAALVAVLCGLAFDPGTNVIEVHMSRLRAKLDRGFAAPMLHTERGRGYRLAAPNAANNRIAATGLAR